MKIDKGSEYLLLLQVKFDIFVSIFGVILLRWAGNLRKLPKISFFLQWALLCPREQITVIQCNEKLKKTPNSQQSRMFAQNLVDRDMYYVSKEIKK